MIALSAIILLLAASSSLVAPSIITTPALQRFERRASPDNTVVVNSADDYCLIVPKDPNTNIGDSEHPGGMTSYCSPSAHSSPDQGVLASDFWKNVQFTSGIGVGRYAQLTGCIDPSKLDRLNPDDSGGQYDSSGGASGAGNPVGSACAGYNHYVELIEPEEQRACIRCCDDPADCPTHRAECISLSHQFTRQLRGELPTQPLSPLVQNILEEVKESPRISFTDQGDLQHTLSITDYLDSVLTSVQMFRELKAHDKNEGFGPRATKPIWSSLIASLSAAWSKDVSDVPFLLPRSLELSLPHIESGCVEGRASLLLCTSISTSEEDLDGDIIDQDMQDMKEEEERSQEDDQSEQDDFVTQSLASDEDEDRPGSFQWAELSVRSLDESDALDGSSSATSLLDLNIPFDAHILPGQGRRTDCFLPIICIAEEQDIFPLVTSAVYQRHLWGISQPTVGILLSKFGTIANVMLGWISPHNSGVDQQLPQVHIALGNRQGDESLGVFDLLDPVSTLYFSQFILNMSSDFQSLSESLQTATTIQLCWRLDHLCLEDRSIMHESEASNNGLTRVEQWVLDVALSESSEHPPFSAAPLDSTQEGMADRQQRKPAAKATPVVASSSKETLLKSITSKSQSSVKSSNKPDSKPDSASNFAAHRVEAGVINVKSGYEFWAWNRGCVRIGRLFVPPTTVGSAVEQINDMVGLYNRLTSFAWPQDWTDMNRMPNVDAVYLSRRQQLYDQFQGAKGGQFNSYLDMASTKLLGSRFSTFFHAVETAASLQDMRKAGLNIYEKETRNTWDTLLYLFCCPEDVAISKSVLLERTIRYPRSKLGPSQVTAAQNLSISYSQADHQRSIALSQYTLSAKDERMAVKETSRENALTILSQCESIYNHFNKMDVASINPNQLAMAMAKDPTNGTTDAVLCVRIPDPSSQKSPESGAVSILTNLMASSSLFSLMKGAVASSFSLGGSCTAKDKHKNCFMCPAVTDSFGSHIILHSVPQKPQTALLVPVFFAEYKKIKDEVEKAFNQCRMYCISGVEFLSTLGIHDFPVFGLVTTGSQGTILMVWKSTRVVDLEDDSTNYRTKAAQAQALTYTYVMDHNLASFDISIPIQAMQFVITIHRIYQYQLRLKDLLKMSDVYSKMIDATFNDWMMKPPVPEADAKGNAAPSGVVS
ncbi:hypothetical protein NLJ89_g8612 [Agrocybe chaxingu]|uniref:Uncharacterized protein n=1 Tax=Agrocybe chaxingu TaxID=84603 RepID=A0A9W8JUX6_9AGAR|nr:hypothetical protein NLJ89_g8612 [Agrocybe chaxingu]